MYNSEFEKKVQEKLDGLGFTPSTSVWDAVEAGLPRKGKRRGWWWLGALLLACITGAVVLYQQNKPVVKHTAAATVTVPAASISQTPATSGVITQDTANNTTQPTPRTTITATTNPAATIQIQAATIHVMPGDVITPVSHKKNNSIVKRPRTKYTITSPGIASINTTAPGIDSDQDMIEQGDAGIWVLPASPVTTALRISSRNTLPVSCLQKKLPWDTLPITNKNTAAQKPDKKPWQLAVSFSAGASSVVNGPFGGAKALPVNASTGSGVGTPATPPINYTIPVRQPGLSFGLGLHLQKLVRPKTRMDIGLRYGYYSGKIAVGSKVDSAVQFNQGGINFNSDAYYRPGSVGSYTNRFHYVELPLTLRFALSRSQSRYPLFIEGGLTAGYLIQSNTLIQRSNGTFFTNRSAQNQLSLAATTGMGLSFGRFDKPDVLLGARLSCGLFSSTRQKIDKQNILSSQLYVQMPVKNIMRLVQRRK